MRSPRPRLAVIGAVLVLSLGLGVAPGVRAVDGDPSPLPPAQPTSGPAGSDYVSPGEPFVSGVDGLGGYTLYEPNPRPATAPLVLLLRGACVNACNMTTTNNIMNAWREHLVKK